MMMMIFASFFVPFLIYVTLRNLTWPNLVNQTFTASLGSFLPQNADLGQGYVVFCLKNMGKLFLLIFILFTIQLKYNVIIV